jgi:hypothetical protein
MNENKRQTTNDWRAMPASAKRSRVVLAVIAAGLMAFAALAVLAWLPATASATTTCLTVPVVNQNGIDGIHTVTAAVVATSGSTISTVGSGCDVGVFVPNTASDVTITATISGETMAGVFADGDASPATTSAQNVTVTGSTISTIGDQPFDGVQYGWGVFFSNGVTGSITGNTISDYQKGGIVVFDFSGPVSDNTVTGLGPVKFIAQNGIQLGYPEGSPENYYFPSTNVANVAGNTVSKNIYTEGFAPPGFVSTGVLLYASTGTVGEWTSVLEPSNTVFSNQCNVCVAVG